MRSSPSEAAINGLQMTIDQQCAQIIAKRQPAAVDLRMVLTVSKIVNDLERIGDEVEEDRATRRRKRAAATGSRACAATTRHARSTMR